MPKVLIVDDDREQLDLYGTAFKLKGYSVETASSGEEGLQKARTGKPDLVLLDIWMPDMDGVTLLKEWAAAGLLNMPVIMMSGHATIDTAVEATRIGAQAFLEKPITLQKLLKAVEQALVRKALAPSLARNPSPLVSEAGSVSVVAAQSALLPPTHHSFELDLPLRDARDAFERTYFEFHLSQENGSMTRVAEKTGLERTHLYRKLKQLGVDLSKPKRGV